MTYRQPKRRHSVTLTALDAATVISHAKDNGLDNFSMGLRDILRLHRERLAQEAGLVTANGGDALAPAAGPKE